MLGDEDLCYQAIKSRDARFDGKVFTGTLSTGIYCRPVCPARMPLRKNVRFFACAAAAEAAGFRPCRLCRPESAPGSPPWLGPVATVSRALGLIERAALDETGVPALARQLGLSPRYLRRLFAKHLGTSPGAVATSRRIHFARSLLGDTALPITEIAFASGFGSIRQFNAVFRQVFRRTPSEFRRSSPQPAPAGDIVALRLAYRPPFDWEELLAFLAARAIPGVECVGHGQYRRTFTGSMGAGVLQVSPVAGRAALELRVRGAAPRDLMAIAGRVRRMFDLDADPFAIGSVLGPSALLARCVTSRPGLRVAGSWDAFEATVGAAIGQQVGEAAAVAVCGRLVRQFGAAMAQEGDLTHLFPSLAELAAADLTAIGLPRAHARELAAVAGSIARDPSLLEPAPDLDDLVARLGTHLGLGPWAAHYVALRAFNEPDAFPARDPGLRRAAGNLSAERLSAVAEAWRPWRAYAAMHLWTLDAKGAVGVDTLVAK